VKRLSAIFFKTRSRTSNFARVLLLFCQQQAHLAGKSKPRQRKKRKTKNPNSNSIFIDQSGQIEEHFFNRTVPCLSSAGEKKITSAKAKANSSVETGSG
jgi:hypothetical protein